MDGGGHCTPGGWTTSHRGDRKRKRKKGMDHERETGEDRGKNMKGDKNIKGERNNCSDR